MLSDKIKKYRKAQKLSQEDLAVRLHVVRQTVSKWENALSVPDADQLITLAAVLGVQVNDLLGTEFSDPADMESIAAELAKANEQIARYAEAERLRTEAGKIRGLMILLALIAAALPHLIGSETLGIALSALLLLIALFVLYRNIGLLSLSFNGSGETGRIKAVTVFDIVLVAAAAVFALLVKTGTIRISENQEGLFSAALISVVILFSGIIGPKLPYNRHAGLRLPWTVQDEGAWNVAHKALGIISIPLGLAYMSLSFFVRDMKTLTLIVVAIWIGVPGLISLLYAYKKTRN
jgi:transcriptional regulator with XRE-family HTH domain